MSSWSSETVRSPYSHLHSSPFSSEAWLSSCSRMGQRLQDDAATFCSHCWHLLVLLQSRTPSDSVDSAAVMIPDDTWFSHFLFAVFSAFLLSVCFRGQVFLKDSLSEFLQLYRILCCPWLITQQSLDMFVYTAWLHCRYWYWLQTYIISLYPCLYH